MNTQYNHFALDNFEGPLDFLLCLIQKEEMDIYEISLQQLVQQCLQKLTEWQERQIELGAEFIGTMAYFVLLKSRMLLPQLDNPIPESELEEDPRFEIIHHLIDYCRFKQTAKDLTVRQEQQSACFYRGLPPLPAYQKPFGIDHLSIEELTDIFKDLMRKADLPRQQIFEENWRVSDKMNSIKLMLRENDIFPLEDLFSGGRSKIELIVTFLALLELMKHGTLTVGKQIESSQLVVCAKMEEK